MLRINTLLIQIAILLLTVIFLPVFVSAQSATAADEQCKEFKGQCAYKTKCPPDGKIIGIVGKTCTDPRGVTGSCVSYGVCKATSAKSDTGGSMNVGDLSKLMQALGQIMQALGKGAGGGGSGSGTGANPGSQGCTQYYQVSTPSSDPCAYYVPSASNSIDTNTTGNTSNTTGNPATDLISTLLGNSSGANNAGDTGSTAIGTTSAGTSVGVSSSTAGQAVGIGPGGINGDIRVLPNGVTVVTSNQNIPGNSIIAGFLGTGATGGAQPTGIVALWCRSRPWASNFLSRIIPPTFFDGLCTIRGYQVGNPPAATSTSQVSLTQTRVPGKIATTTPATTTPAIRVPPSPPMTVDIWAVPAKVQLGARTEVFWTSKNAASCVETSPEGNFSHNTLSGGAATVSISGATTFTISCTAPDGTHASDFVTVNLAI